MRILYDSKKTQYKFPFGTLEPGQSCRLCIHIPHTVQTSHVLCRISGENGAFVLDAPMSFARREGAYDHFEGSFSLNTPGLYFYHFVIFNPAGSFRLFKQGDDTNMEAGGQWQVSCIPQSFTTPDWAKGATIYQIFPDRFHKYGDCDLTGKLEPYTVHSHWDEEVHWQPTAEGVVLNNDFYGGNFRGITEKMDYIASLGTTILYLNPISKSFSNHRYDTGDYKTPDPMLGTLSDFSQMCQAAHERGIHVILDGVFSHTGANSLYFDRERTFGGNGAYCTQNSPYYSWYQFYWWPNAYRSWWNFDTLPTVNKLDPGFLEYIITGPDSVVNFWLCAGADGFRLDVADELPDEFLRLLKQQVRKTKPDALVIGEVWEDASNKIAYDVRRRYFVDGTLDSIMNYPFRTAILRFVRGEDWGQGLRDTVLTIAENYPPQVLPCNMNLLGTHDTPRILTALVDDFQGSREQQACHRLSPEQLKIAQQRLHTAAVLQYTLPGSPSLYYGDEAGMEGCKDPFNRRPYPWGQENPELLGHFRTLGKLRKEQEALRLGHISFFHWSDQQLGFCREYRGKTLRIYINRSNQNWEIPAMPVLLEHNADRLDGSKLILAPMGYCVLEEN